MIKIEKDYNCIPDSLRTDEEGLRSRIAANTNEKRLEVIRMGRYPDPQNAAPFDTRYKYDDIKCQLESIYNKKCCYCESSNEQLTIEHYRPKRGGYYWLAFSWDNLFLCCTTCNIRKKSQFPIQGTPVKYDPKRDTINSINSLGRSYDLIERPLIINPENVDSSALDTIRFDKHGGISSSDTRMAKTIEVCALDRKALQETRQQIWDDLRANIADAIVSANGSIDKLTALIAHDLKAFIRKMEDPKTPYRSFYKFVLKAGWVNEYIYSAIV